MPSTKQLQRLVEIIATLRGPNGCNWDRSQDLVSMRAYLLEETYEALAALDALSATGNDAPLEEELGDLLFVVLLLCQIATDEQRFDLDSVCNQIAQKMITRHPHIFSQRNKTKPASLKLNWENQKAEANAQRSRLAGVPRILPALARTHIQGKKAAAIGFDWSDYAGVLDKIEEEQNELQEALARQDKSAIQHEYGDLLMAVANLGRHIQVSPEEALREANDRFATRFRHMEQATTNLATLSAEQLEVLWERAKKSLSSKQKPSV